MRSGIADGGGREPRELVPVALRRPALAVIAVATAVVAALGARYAGMSAPGSLDRTVDGWIIARLGRYQDSLRTITDLGGVPAVAVLIVLIAVPALATGRVRLAVLAVLGPSLAGAITQYALKPLIGRTHLGGLAFPSGHSTGAFAIAAVVVVLLLDPRARLSRTARAWLGVVALACASCVAVALVAAGFHYATDTVGGAGVAIAIVLAVALLVDVAAQWIPRAGRYVAIRTATPGRRDELSGR